MSLTIFILPSDGEGNVNKLIDSLGDIPNHIKILSHRELEKEAQKVSTDWFGYFFLDECLQNELRDAIPVFLKCTDKECLTLFRRHMHEDSKPSYSQAPRIFMRHVKMKGTQPSKEMEYSYERVLDGFIEDTDAY